jgi:hypothetical protein
MPLRKVSRAVKSLHAVQRVRLVVRDGSEGPNAGAKMGAQA